MIKAVLDANILASGSVHAAGASGQLIDAWRANLFELISSEHILTELANTHQKRYFRARLTPGQSSRFQALLRRRATITPLTIQVSGVATHPEDDLVLASAVSARADYLVTGDTKLLALGTYQGVQIVSPRAFLEILLAQTPTA